MRRPLSQVNYRRKTRQFHDLPRKKATPPANRSSWGIHPRGQKSLARARPIMPTAKNITFQFWELRSRPQSAFISLPELACVLVGSASEHEKGASHNPKGVVADDRNFDKDAKDRESCDHERGDNSPVHLRLPGHSPLGGAHPPVNIHHTVALCTRRNSLDLT